MKPNHQPIKLTLLLLVVLTGSTLLAACAAPQPGQAAECSRLLAIADQDMEAAKAKGFSSTVTLTKAAGLLAAARIQLQFNKYPNCINKANRARKLIRQAEQENVKKN